MQSGTNIAVASGNHKHAMSEKLWQYTQVSCIVADYSMLIARCGVSVLWCKLTLHNNYYCKETDFQVWYAQLHADVKCLLFFIMSYKDLCFYLAYVF